MLGRVQCTKFDCFGHVGTFHFLSGGWGDFFSKESKGADRKITLRISYVPYQVVCIHKICLCQITDDYLIFSWHLGYENHGLCRSIIFEASTYPPWGGGGATLQVFDLFRQACSNSHNINPIKCWQKNLQHKILMPNCTKNHCWKPSCVPTP